MSAAQPWLKFYPRDWRSDEKLRMCGLAARGLWIEMLAIMHSSEKYGQLLIGGKIPSDAQLAMQVGCLPSEVAPLIAELESADVFSRTRVGIIYSRRMISDQKTVENARKNGKQGGNPTLGNKKEKTAPVKGQDNGEDKDTLKLRSQIPDTRYQKEEEFPLPPKLEDEPAGKQEPQQGVEPKYVFEGGTIKLNAKNFDQWRVAYHTIPDLRAELTSFDQWFDGANEETRKDWFRTTSRNLNRKHQENLAKGVGPPSGNDPLVDGILLRHAREEAARNA